MRSNPFMRSAESLSSKDVRLMKVQALVSVFMYPVILWVAWTKIWIPDGGLLGTLALVAFSLFGLLIVVLNIRSATRAHPSSGD